MAVRHEGKLKKSRVKLFVTDLDGTVINRDNRVSENVLAALHRLSDAGISIAVATGRPERLIPEYISNLPNLGFIISGNGAVICSCPDNIRLKAAYIENSTAFQIYKETTALKGGMDLYTHNSCINEKRSWELALRFLDMSEEAKQEGSKLFTLVPDLKNRILSEEEPIVKLVCRFPDKTDCKILLQKIIKEGKAEAVSLSGYEIEISARDATKGSAIRFIRKYLGIKKTEIIYLGDGENDLSARGEVGLFVAMGNAGDAIKNAAGWIAPSIDEDGAAQTVEKLLCGDL